MSREDGSHLGESLREVVIHGSRLEIAVFPCRVTIRVQADYPHQSARNGLLYLVKSLPRSSDYRLRRVLGYGVEEVHSSRYSGEDTRMALNKQDKVFHAGIESCPRNLVSFSHRGYRYIESWVAE
ncbi:MAG: hypothetical protein CV087_17480 [Candidatus Brocadia sp. WS118]|nr:MAG: hypothetical protein CV087_17480 [Candidatus Brocadia sp. WS118]